MDLTDPAGENTGSRMVFVDALRGIAAFSVLFHHLAHTNRYAPSVRAYLPWLIDAYGDYGRYGVQVFFVISGFVIAHSLRDTPATVRSIGNFILRRQVRLDPPYWTLLLLTLAWGLVTTPAFCYPPPWQVGKGEILANFFYLHRVLGCADLLIVAWTLCLEIQFYLLTIALLVVARVLCRGRRSPTVEAFLFFITGIASVAYRVSYPHSPGDIYTWFPYGWCLFAGGALANLSVRDPRTDGHFRSFLMLFLAFYTLGRNSWRPDSVIGVSTIALLWGSGKAGKLTSWLGNWVFRYFGRISYSLYLIHFPIIATIFAYAHSLAARETDGIGVIWFPIATIASIAAAHLLFVAVERPSMRLASRFKRTEAPTSNTPAALTIGQGATA